MHKFKIDFVITSMICIVMLVCFSIRRFMYMRLVEFAKRGETKIENNEEIVFYTNHGGALKKC